mmetsp:Transcript_57603/g.184993  ORF Transcript_57603/g.184993 Transcript_57603/m.184993 type:complete len:248 (-) Transcript_57603:12-755(-)
MLQTAVDLADHVPQVLAHVISRWINRLRERIKPPHKLLDTSVAQLRPQHLGEHQQQQHLHKVLDGGNRLPFLAKAVQHEGHKVDVAVSVSLTSRGCVRAALEVDGHNNGRLLLVLMQQAQELPQVCQGLQGVGARVRGASGGLGPEAGRAAFRGRHDVRHRVPVNLASLRLVAGVVGHHELHGLPKAPTARGQLRLVEVDVPVIGLVDLVAGDEAVALRGREALHRAELPRARRRRGRAPRLRRLGR